MSQRERIATWPSDRANRIAVRATETLSGNRTATAAEVDQYQALSFDCNGAARNLVLPPEENCAGLMLFVRNATAATHALTVQNDAAGTVVAIPAAKGGMVWCDGTSWFSLLGA